MVTRQEARQLQFHNSQFDVKDGSAGYESADRAKKFSEVSVSMGGGGENDSPPCIPGSNTSV